MPTEQVIVQAIIQGLTEFLPISSSAHLILVRYLLHWEDPGLAFDVALHAGTLIAVLIYFASTWVKLFRSALGRPVRISDETLPNANLSPDEMRRERMLLWYLIAATIPGAIIGKLFDKRVDEYFHGEDLAKHVPIIAGALIVVALIMWASEKMATFRKPITGITALDAMIIGCAQACAVLPGVSRSGSTIAAGFFRGMSREAAVRFSFLLATPLIAGAALLKGYHLMKEHPSHEMVTAMLLGIAISAVVGYGVIWGMVRYLRTRSLAIFIVYRLVFGIIIIALAFSGSLK